MTSLEKFITDLLNIEMDRIEKLISNANGFTNFKRTRNRILYCLNKNDTYKI